MRILPIPLALALSLLLGCEKPSDGKVHLSYWEKWTGKEATAMQRVVDQFNRSQDRIIVEYLSVSQIERKAIVATAGGDPPDVMGMFIYSIYSFADRGALLPLDDFLRRDGLTSEQWLAHYSPVYADMCTYRGATWAVPSAPSTFALYWNKTLFRAAGLDPERPPRTLAELDLFAEKLSQKDASGKILQLGFLPQEPGWASWAFPQWFGGQLTDERSITLTPRPENLAAYRWVESYSKKYGHGEINAFASGFGSFNSPQNPFFAGKLGMVFQGVWMNHFIQQFAPNLEYGCAPWPTAGVENFAVADSDILLIPRGAKHPNEAWEFVKFVNSINPHAQSEAELRGVELLCWGQQKNSPLRQWSPYFEQHHPHPFIRVHRQLAESPQAIHYPKIGIWQEYSRELANLFDRFRLLDPRRDAAFTSAQTRVAESWEVHQRSLERRNKKSLAENAETQRLLLPIAEGAMGNKTRSNENGECVTLPPLEAASQNSVPLRSLREKQNSTQP